MKIMNIAMLCSSALLALTIATASAQTKHTISGTCSKPDGKSIPAGDQPDHSFMIGQGTCTTKGEVGGATSKEGAFSEHDDVTATRMKGWGVYTETYDSGDKIFYRYQLSVGMKDGALQSGTGTFQAIDGTGKMKGIKAKGMCKYSPGADGGTNYSCTGDYTLAGAKMAAKQGN